MSRFRSRNMATTYDFSTPQPHTRSAAVELVPRKMIPCRVFEVVMLLRCVPMTPFNIHWPCTYATRRLLSNNTTPPRTTTITTTTLPRLLSHTPVPLRWLGGLHNRGMVLRTLAALQLPSDFPIVQLPVAFRRQRAAQTHASSIDGKHNTTHS
jgi:hypothetical protein